MNINVGDICMVDFTNDKNDRFTGIRPCLVMEIKNDMCTVLKLTTNQKIIQSQGIIIRKEIKTGLIYDSALVKHSSVIKLKLIISKVGSFDLNMYVGKSIKFYDKVGDIYNGIILKFIYHKRVFIVSYEGNSINKNTIVPIHAIIEVKSNIVH